MAQRLETIIAINARAGDGFADVGNTLTQLGAQVDQISEKLISFGRDSLKTYEKYEVSMSEAKAALAANSDMTTKQLEADMDRLDAAARKWASSTIFHTNEVGNAINVAAHADWDTPDILANMPAAMELAQAGSMDLADAVTYLVQAQKNLGVETSDIGNFIDMWAYSASNSVGDIKKFGKTLETLGSVGRFADTNEELFAMIGMMHDMGTEGSQAATLLRTTWMRMLAPPGVPSLVLEQLGWTESDIEEAGIMEDHNLKDTIQYLNSLGFSAFDENGMAKPLMQTFSELRDVLAEIAGGYDKIEKNEKTLGILSTLFGMRGIKGAENIINAMEHGIELQDQLKNGYAAGYGSFYSETMMDTLYGSIETWKSKVENLEARTGEVLSEQLRPVLDTLGGIVDNIAELDSGTFNAIVAGLEVIAGAGPGLLLAGGAFRAIAYALTPAGGIGLGLIALLAAARAVDELEKADFASKFGDMELDAEGIQNYVQNISNDFQTAYSKVSQFTEALGNAVTKYTEASSAFKSGLVENMLTGAEITEGSPEYEKLVSLGEDMIAAVKSGIENNHAATMNSITTSFAEGGNPDDVDNPIWAQIFSVIEIGFQKDIDRAKELSRQLREALTSAFKDGHLTGEEIKNIQTIMDEQNELLAQQADREHYIERQSIMRKAQTLGLNAIRESSAIVQAERDAEWESLKQRQDADYYDAATWYDYAIENGLMVPNTDGTPGEHAATEADKAAALAALKGIQSEEEYRWKASFSDFLMGLWEEGITSSELGSTWDALAKLGRIMRVAGGIVTQKASDEYVAATTPDDAVQAQLYLAEMVEALGGYGALQEYADYFTRHGNEEMAERYRRIMDMYDAMGNPTDFIPVVGTMGNGNYDSDVSYSRLLYALDDFTPEVLRDYLLQQYEEGISKPNWAEFLGEDQYVRLNTVAQSRGETITKMIEDAFYNTPSFEDITARKEINDAISSIAQMRGQIDEINTNGLWQRVSGNSYYRLSDEYEEAEKQRIEADIAALQNELAELYAGNGISIPIAPFVGGIDAAQQLQDQGVKVDVDGDTQQLQATIDGADGQTLMEYVDGDASDLEMSITDQNGRILTEYVHGDATHLAEVINSYSGRTITVAVRGARMFAEGGRATEASIFGEGRVPEWAIPEEHSQRTADLLNAARAASGFTWPELLARYGGLNANPGGTPVTLVYSPTIYAQNAEGVEEKLEADKKRFEKWLSEKAMMDRLEVYS